VQAAAVELLKEHETPFRNVASIVWQERFEFAAKVRHADEAPEVGGWLAVPSFWTEIEMREDLRERLWPAARVQDLREAFRESELRAQLLSSAGGSGLLHRPYIMTISTGSLEPGWESSDEEGVRRAATHSAFLDLESQMQLVVAFVGCLRRSRSRGSLRSDLDVNCPDASASLLRDCAALWRATPAAADGRDVRQVNQTLVRQFRMPGYPLVLVSTDLLQEGEDLHTFCSAIQHYGISWTPSAMEQRIGRIDRVRSQTDRRLGQLDRAVTGDEMLQVYYPHLQETVEVLQVRRVIERMDAFLRLVHEGLVHATGDERSVDVTAEAAHRVLPLRPIRGLLRTSFPIPAQALRGDKKRLAVSKEDVDTAVHRFESLRRNSLPGLVVDWEPFRAREAAGYCAPREAKPAPSCCCCSRSASVYSSAA
jgi:hypothetical protein